MSLSLRRGWVLLASVLLLAGCGNLQWPPASSGPRLANPPRAANPPPRRSRQTLPLPASGAVTVQPGESLFVIAQRYGLSVRALIDRNNLVPPYHLIAGQRLALPRAQEHVVRRGETLYGISRRFDVNMYALARANLVRPPYHIQAGQRLKIPYGPGEAVPPKPSSRSVPSAVEPSRKPTAPGVRRRPQAPALSPPPGAGRGFIWPVRGRVVSKFGDKGKGLHNDGINILAPRGEPVRAVDTGVVAYAGNQLRGFGNLLLIKHRNGWITAYAHNESLLVRRGDRVGRGQIVARVGSTGNVSSPQLHFEIRKGKQAVDPQRHLRRLKARQRLDDRAVMAITLKQPSIR